eukprot:scaffold8184_cov258-Pinguiococcus_pyrenoidosus.AAC.2
MRTRRFSQLTAGRWSTKCCAGAIRCPPKRGRWSFGASRAIPRLLRGRGMGHRADDGRGALGRVAGLEDAAAHEDSVHTELHHQGRVGRRGHAPRGEVHYRQLARGRHFSDEVVRRPDLLRVHEELVFVHGLHSPNLAVHGPRVAHGLHHVARSRLALGAKHRGALRHATQGLAQVAAAAHKRDLELVLVDVVL